MLTFSIESDFDYRTAVWSDWTWNWIDEPLTDSKSYLLFAAFSSFFSLFFNFFCLFFSSSFLRIVCWISDIIGSLKFSFSFLFNILKKLFSEIFIIVIKNSVVELKESLIFNLKCSNFGFIELYGAEVHIFKWKNWISSKNWIYIDINGYWSMGFHSFSFEYLHKNIGCVTVSF